MEVIPLAQRLMDAENARAAAKEKYLDPNYQIYVDKFDADHVLFPQSYDHPFDRHAKVYYIISDDGYVNRLTYQKFQAYKTQRIHVNGIVILTYNKNNNIVCISTLSLSLFFFFFFCLCFFQPILFLKLLFSNQN